MKYAFFLGCVIPVKYPGFEKASREIMQALDVELVDLPFSCCPAPTTLKLAHYDTWLALAARNLCLAAEAGLPQPASEADRLRVTRMNNKCWRCIGTHFGITCTCRENTALWLQKFCEACMVM